MTAPDGRFWLSDMDLPFFFPNNSGRTIPISASTGLCRAMQNAMQGKPFRFTR